jgi:hypothetical protein
MKFRGFEWKIVVWLGVSLEGGSITVPRFGRI